MYRPILAAFLFRSIIAIGYGISGDDISGMKILVQYSRFALFSILSCLKLNVTVDINCAVRTIKGVNSQQSTGFESVLGFVGLI